MYTSAFKNNWAPIVLIFLLCLIGYRQLLDSHRVPYSQYSDIIAQHLGIKMLSYKSFQENHGLPFWRNDTLAGVQIFTNPESQYLYPLHFLFYLLPPLQAVGPTIWIHFLFGALIFFWIGRAMRLGVWACLFMALAQLFNFKMIAGTYAGFLPILPILIFFPLLFLACFYQLRQPNLKGCLAVGAAGFLCLNTGVFQLYYYSILFLAGYFIWFFIISLRRKQSRPALQVFAWLTAGFMLSLGMMAYHLLPLAAEAKLLSRGNASYEFFLSGYTLTPKHLLTFLYPEALGSLFAVSELDRYLWEDIAYFGLIPLCLAFLGALLGWRRHPQTIPLVIAFLTTLVLAVDTPLLKCLYNFLPGFGLFRVPNRFLYLSGFFGICLAGIGLELILLRFRAKGKHVSIGLAFVLLALISIEGFHYSKRYVITYPANEILPQTDFAAFFNNDQETFRIAPLFRHTINNGWAALMGLEFITGYTPFNLKHYKTYTDLLQWGNTAEESAYSWIDIFNITRWDLLDALNVKYIASPVPVQALYQAGFARPPDLDEVAHFRNQPMFFFFNLGLQRKDIYIYRNNNFLKRAFWVEELISLTNEKDFMSHMLMQNLRKTAVISEESATASNPIRFVNTSDDHVTVVSASGGRLDLEVQNRENRFLVISEIWHPGWRASLNNTPVKLHKTNAALMGTWIPKGRHRLMLSFKPLYWQPAIQISAVSIALFLAGLVVVVRKNTQKTSLIGTTAEIRL